MPISLPSCDTGKQGCSPNPCNALKLISRQRRLTGEGECWGIVCGERCCRIGDGLLLVMSSVVKRAPSLAWPGYRVINEIDGSSGGVVISHGLIEHADAVGVEAVLPTDQIMLCVHIGGSIWMRNRSSFTNYEREGRAGTANLGIGGLTYDIEYRAERCECVRFLLARSWFEHVLEDQPPSNQVEFIDPQNRPDHHLTLLAQMALRRSSTSPVDRLLADSIGYAVAAEILRTWSNITVAGMPSYSESNLPADRRMMLVHDYIEDNLTSPVSLNDLAAVSGLSMAQFMRLFKATFGVTPYRWTLKRKMDRAKLMITQEGLSVTQAAYELNFSSSQHFSTIFRKLNGITPSTFKRLMHPSNE